MGIIATDQSGLADATTYYFKVNDVEYDITTGVSPTYQDVTDLIDTALDSAGFGAKIIEEDNSVLKNSLLDSLIGYWSLNDGVGITAKDNSIYSNNGTLEGTNPTWVNGISGKAVNFPGTNERIDCGNGAPLDDLGNGDFSISLWMKSKDTVPLNYGMLFSKMVDGNNRIDLFSYGTANRLGFSIKATTGIDNTPFSTGTTPFDTNLNYIVLVINRTTDKALLYMNTVKDATEIDISACPADCSNAGNLYWGSRSNDTAPYEGLEDECRIYDRILTEDEIDYLCNNPSGSTGEDIRIYNDAVRGSGSTCLLEQSDTSPDLFSSLNFWSSFRKAPVLAAPFEVEVITEMNNGVTLTGEGDIYISVPPYGFYGGGWSGSNSNIIDYISTAFTIGNAIDRGDLTVARGHLAGVSGSQYGFYGGGHGDTDSNVIDYIDMTLTIGDAIDRGDLTLEREYLAGVSGPQYGFYGSCFPGNVIDYIDMTLTTGDAIDRGDLTIARYASAGVSGSQYGFYGGGASLSNVIDYIDMTLTTGDAIDRGDLTVARYGLAGVSGSQYGFYGGGIPTTNVIDYIDMTLTTGDAIDRGDLTVARKDLAGVSGPQYGFYGGGYEISDWLNVIDYIDMTLTTSDAIDKGDLTVARIRLAGVS